MRSSKVIHIVSCHAEGEVGDVIVGRRRAAAWRDAVGAAQASSPRTRPAQFRAERAARRRVPPHQPARAAEGSACGDGLHHHGAGGHAADVRLQFDLRLHRAARQRHRADAGAGNPHGAGSAGRAGECRRRCRNGKAERITVTNVPSFADRLDAKLEVEGLGTLTVDTAYGGDSFVITDARALGFAVTPDEARELAETGMRITKAANEQLGFTHPENPEWTTSRSAS
jgi:hypothetical protein